MTTRRTTMRRARGLVGLLALIVAAALAAVAFAAAPPASNASLPDLRWRLIGPLRSGWSTCATGVPGKPSVFYFGAADGGVWKTTDAGRTWNPVFDRQPASSIGALAVAPSSPDVLYAGTGQIETRYDVMDGNGVYRSADGGATWTPAGLAETRHIGRILVDPRDANVVLVAAVGHMFGPGGERGLFRTTNAGLTWDKVLPRDADTGAVDLASDEMRPDVIFAALWQIRRHPWLDYHTPAVGPGSGIWKSTDGGKSWAPATESAATSPAKPGASGPVSSMPSGLPTVPMGRIGLAVAPRTADARVYASIDAGKQSGLYRSEDGGAHWKRVNDDASLANSYFSRVTVDPRDPDTVYVMGRSVRRSTDGGRTFTVTRGAPGGDDFHFLWIDPKEPERMILASDQGTIVSLNGGATWSSWYNQPTGQFYHLAADNRFPYWVYSSQQDSGTAAVASRSDYGQLTFRDWHPVGGEERDFALPDPEDPDTVFVSGLGGTLTRYDARTGRIENASPWPVSSYAKRPETVRYRYGWITPIAISPVAPHALYQGAQMLFRSLDKGRHWETISPDLTGAASGVASAAGGAGAAANVAGGARDAQAGDCKGDVPIARARACGYGTISAIAPSPVERDRIWIGTDDGLIQVTTDGGKTWRNATPSVIGDWSKISIIDPSPTDAATAYVAVDRHRLDDFEPHLYRTHDEGRTWADISAGLPAGSYVITVRQDPVELRLLFAGTRAGVQVSFDDGDHWRSLQANLPPTGVNDLLVHGDDLIAATQGRALWILDDISPLRQVVHRAPADTPFLFAPSPGVRVRANMNRDTPLPPEEPTTPNPPAGIAIDYDLGAAPQGPVTLEIHDASGALLRRWSSETSRTPPKTEERYFAEEWLKPEPPLPAGPGTHRIHWDLRQERPEAIEYEYGIAATPETDTPLMPQGALGLPGRYEVRLVAAGQPVTRPVTVLMDPRVRTSAADLEAQRLLYREAGKQLARAAAAFHEIEALEARLKATLARPEPKSRADRAARDRARQLETDLAEFKQESSDESLVAVGHVLAATVTDLELTDGPPTQPQRDVVAEYARRLDAVLLRWQAFQAKHLAGPDVLPKEPVHPPISPGH
jgi:photosystem II stability/assembly factor-like uncharacterized protein